MIILISMIPFGTSCFLVYKRAVNAMQNESEIIEQKQMDKMTASLDRFINSMDKMCIAILQRQSVRQIFSIKESTVNLSSNYMDIMNDLNLFTLSYGYIRNINVYSELNNTIVSQVTVSKAENDTSGMIEDFRKADDGIYIAVHNSNGAGIKTVTFMRKKYIGSEAIGAVSIDVHIDRLFEELGIFYNDKNDRLMLADKDGRVILSSFIDDINTESAAFSQDRADDGANIINLDGTEYMLDTAEAKPDGLRYVHLYSRVSYTNADKQMIRLIIIMIFFSLIIVLLIAVYISTQTFKPLAEILEYFDKEENEQFSDSNELGYIIRSISSLTNENVSLTEEMQKRIVMMNKTQIQALQNQINPHFMFNTLETIKWMVMDLEEDNKVSSMIEMLADVISYSTNMERYLVDLDEEIRNTKIYIEILKIRYEEKFSVDWDIEEGLCNIRVLKLCLQPIIENAIIHGIVPKRAYGTIRITVKTIKKNLLIVVADDGVGIDPEKLEKLSRELNNMTAVTGKHIGLKNVNLRTRLVFGEEYGISVSSEKGKGTEVRLLMKKNVVSNE